MQTFHLFPISNVNDTSKLDEGFRGKDLYDELFKPTEKWYTSQMERRDAELKAIQDAKYVHHNLGKQP